MTLKGLTYGPFTIYCDCNRIWYMPPILRFQDKDGDGPGRAGALRMAWWFPVAVSELVFLGF